jgi:nitroimidazol reductase NimA-like FMN-containing flavoprotein (pyridoxamine 5'-phosphate oxidase superfamily)
MRRHDREIKDQSEIKTLLRESQFGFIATAFENQPFIHANLFWYDEKNQRIYFHTALEGRARSNIETNPKICFSVATMGRLLPADTAMGFSTEYASVTVFGNARIADDAMEQRYGLQGLLDKYFPQLRPGNDYNPITDADLQRTSVFAMEIEAWSGKHKVAES